MKRPNRLRYFALAALPWIVAACSDAGALTKDESAKQTASAEAAPLVQTPPDEQSSAEVKRTGSPALPPPDNADAPIESEARIISLNDVARGDRSACQINFTYPGYPAQEILWFDEACSALSPSFMDREKLEAAGRWQRIDEYGQMQIAKRTGGIVFYVEGQFTASVFPMDYNNAPMEVAVAD